MILSLGCWIPQHEGKDMARGAETLNKTQHQSISELPNQTWTIISAALTLVHEQKTEIRVNKVIYLTLCKVTYCLWLPDSQAKRKHKLHTANIHKRKKIESSNFPHNGTFLPLKMLISHSLMRPYLHYKHCFQTPRKKKSEEVREPSCSSSIRGVRQSRLCLPRTAMQDTRLQKC